MTDVIYEARNHLGNHENPDVIDFVLLAVPLVQVQVATHAGEVGHGRGHVVLHIHLVEVNQIWICSRILKPYSYTYMKRSPLEN